MKLTSLLSFVLSLGAIAVSAASGAELVNRAGASRVALGGYDAVAFFTDNQPVHGQPSITSEYQGATYFFATAEHKSAFAAAPEKYAPQFGGFCAFGVSVGALFPIDVSTYQVLDGKLYVVLNPDIRKAFDADRAGVLARAEANWPKLVRDNAQ